MPLCSGERGSKLTSCTTASAPTPCAASEKLIMLKLSWMCAVGDRECARASLAPIRGVCPPTRDREELERVETELGIADAGVANGAGNAEADDETECAGDAVVVDVDGALDDLEWPTAERAPRRWVRMGRWPQWMHAYSGCSHAQGAPPTEGRTGMSPTPVDSRRGLATGDVWTWLSRCCLLCGDGGAACTATSGFLRRRTCGGESVCTSASLRDLVTRVAVFLLPVGLGGGEDGGTLASEGAKLSFTLFDVEPVRRGVDVALGELTCVGVADGDIALDHVFGLAFGFANDLELEGSDHPTRLPVLGLAFGTPRISSSSSSS